MQRLLLTWGVQTLAFARVFSLSFIKLNRHLLYSFIGFFTVLTLESLAYYPQEYRILVNHVFSNYYFMNVIAFTAIIIVKNIVKALFYPAQPKSLVGINKYAIDIPKKAASAITVTILPNINLHP